MEWRSIHDNPPKDGTEVDLWGINHLHYAKQQLRICKASWGPVTDWFGNERDDWRTGRGEDFEPTHWLLVTPPAEPTKNA
jgi:hypothetical protein